MLLRPATERLLHRQVARNCQIRGPFNARIRCHRIQEEGATIIAGEPAKSQGIRMFRAAASGAELPENLPRARALDEHWPKLEEVLLVSNRQTIRNQPRVSLVEAPRQRESLRLDKTLIRLCHQNGVSS